MTSPIDAPLALSYRGLIKHKLQNGLVSEIFSIKVADRHTDVTQTDRSLKACSVRASYLSQYWIVSEKRTEDG